MSRFKSPAQVLQSLPNTSIDWRNEWKNQLCAHTKADGKVVYLSVEKAVELIEKLRREPKKIPVNTLPSLSKLQEKIYGARRKYALNTEIDKPGILGFMEGRIVLIDGRHRLFNLLYHQRKNMPCFVLSEEETLETIVSDDQWKESAK